MPRPVCVKCQREMIFTTSVTVQFNAFVTGGAYQQWQADLAECPDCHVQIAIRFGAEACWHHHDGTPAPTPDIISREVNGLGQKSP